MHPFLRKTERSFSIFTHTVSSFFIISKTLIYGQAIISLLNSLPAPSCVDKQEARMVKSKNVVRQSKQDVQCTSTKKYKQIPNSHECETGHVIAGQLSRTNFLVSTNPTELAWVSKMRFVNNSKFSRKCENINYLQEGLR